MPTDIDPSATADQTRLFRVQQNGTNDCTIHATQVKHRRNRTLLPSLCAADNVA